MRNPGSSSNSDKLWKSTKKMLGNSFQNRRNEVYDNQIDEKHESLEEDEDSSSIKFQERGHFHSRFNDGPHLTSVPSQQTIDESSSFTSNHKRPTQREYRTPKKQNLFPILNITIVFLNDQESVLTIYKDRDISFSIMQFCMEHGIDDIALVEILKRKLMRELERVDRRARGIKSSKKALNVPKYHSPAPIRGKSPNGRNSRFAKYTDSNVKTPDIEHFKRLVSRSKSQRKNSAAMKQRVERLRDDISDLATKYLNKTKTG